MDNLTLQGSVLAPMSSILEANIQKCMQEVVEQNKTGVITLKINVSAVENYDDEKLTSWLEPIIEYQVSRVLKETKKDFKSAVGFGHKIEKDDEGVIYLEDIR